MVEQKDESLIIGNTGLVHACCKRFTGRGVEYDDLYQSGCIGLVKAAKAFDPGRGFQFSTYAVPVILGEIKKIFRDGGSVKVSRSLKDLSYKALREKERLSKKLGREPTISELAEVFGVTPEEMGEALCSAAPVTSLTVYDEDGEREADLPDDDRILEITENIALRDAIRNLGESDEKLITYRYFKGKTQSETARILGMSQVQVSRREKYIFMELRRLLA